MFWSCLMFLAVALCGKFLYIVPRIWVRQLPCVNSVWTEEQCIAYSFNLGVLSSYRSDHLIQIHSHCTECSYCIRLQLPKFLSFLVFPFKSICYEMLKYCVVYRTFLFFLNYRCMIVLTLLLLKNWVWIQQIGCTNTWVLLMWKLFLLRASVQYCTRWLSSNMWKQSTRNPHGWMIFSCVGCAYSWKT